MVSKSFPLYFRMELPAQSLVLDIMMVQEVEVERTMMVVVIDVNGSFFQTWQIKLGKSEQKKCHQGILQYEEHGIIVEKKSFC